MVTLTGFDARRDVLPILMVTEGEDPDIKAFMGTGFVLGKNVFVTCHHCVSTPLDEGDRYVVAIPVEYVQNSEDQTYAGPYGIGPLTDIAKDPTGLDLATAKAAFSSTLLDLSDSSLSMGENIFTYGYPLTEDLPHPVAGRSLTVNGRYLEGYCTTTYYHEVPGYIRTPTYELDMPAPIGLSGAPIVKRDGAATVAGVVYGTKDTGTVEEFARIDETTGERTPELQRITTFAVAHYFDSLYNLRGPATDHMPLGEYLRS